MTARKQKRPVLPTLTEKQEEFYCDKAARMMGWTVIRFSQPRRTMQTRGWVDRLYVHRGRGVAVFAEMKAEKGKLSLHQKEMLELLSCVKETHTVHGTANVVGQFLAERLTEKR